MGNYASKVIKIAEAEVGYLEKKSNKYLDEKTANAGSKNYTKYGRDMHDLYPSVMDFPAAWCDAFVDWCFYKAYGKTNAKGLLGGNFNDYTPSSANLYKNKKAWHTAPKVGDQIFFTNGERICHTGLVYKVDSNYVYTIEGNTSDEDEVVANGGCVAKKKYLLTNKKIAGYGRPKYDSEPVKKVETEENKVDYADFFTKNYAKTFSTTANLNLRIGAGTNKKVVCVMPKGAKVTCYGYYSKVGSTVWLLVSYGKYTGFCSKKYLK